MNEITRCRMVQGVLQESLLDQVLYTNDALVSSVKLLSSLGKSDHMSLKIELGVSLAKPICDDQAAVKKPAWSKVSENDILDYSLKNIDWKYSCEEISSNMMYNELMVKLGYISDIVPLSRFVSYNRPLNLPWSNSRLQCMRKNKDLAWNNFCQSPTK